MSEEQATTTLWSTLVDLIRQDNRLSPQLLGFLPLVEAKGVLGETLYLEVPNEFTRNMIEREMRINIQDALAINGAAAEASGERGPINFAVVVNPEIEENFTRSLVPAEPVIDESVPFTFNADLPRTDFRPHVVEPFGSTRTTSNIGFDTRLNPKYTFERFVTGGSNRFAHAAAFAVSEQPAKAYNPLFIYGDSGLGKTHLLHAIGHYALSLYPRIKVRYVSSEEFTNDFINAIQNNKTNQFQAEYRDIDVLLIDDIQFLSGKDQTQEAFFHTFNTLHDHNKQVVITSDLPPKQLSGFEDRMLSRFEWGLITDIQAPELETRIAILRKKAENEHLGVPDEVIEYMAERVSSNIRELEGTLIRVTAFANLQRQPVDMDLVQTLLKDVVPLGESIVVAPIDIINAVASYYKISPDEIYSSSRAQAIALARQIAMYLCREQTGLSLPKIGEIFGRDHTTVMHANKKINDLMNERRYVYTQITEIIHRIKGKNA